MGQAFLGTRQTSPAPTSRQGLDKTWILRRIAQRLAQLADSRVQAVIEIDDGVVGLEALLQFLARDEFARALQQHRQNFEGLFLELDLRAVAAQLSRATIHFVDSEPNQVWKGGRIRHGTATRWRGVYHSPQSHSTTLQRGDDERCYGGNFMRRRRP